MEHGHRLGTAALYDHQAHEEAVALLVCTVCGAWATAASQETRSLLLRPCRRPTRAGKDVLSRVLRGLHPKAGHGPPLLAMSAAVAEAVAAGLAAVAAAAATTAAALPAVQRGG